MDEIEVINILKRYSDKKTEREREGERERQTDRQTENHHLFLFCAAIWPYLAHSWFVLNYMCKTKYKTLEDG